MSAAEIKKLIEQTLDTNKAADIVSIEIADSSLADHMIVASGTSSRHVASLARNLKDCLLKKGIKGITIEGIPQADWVVMDAGDIIVHLFRPEVREFYNIEKMWCAHPTFDVVPESQIQA
ncbi:MAG: ribosome silencing factor [Alphaproteobacteria bacterium]